MRFLFYTHSLVSDWNHGNAHFLRGVTRELISRGHHVLALEPADGWSRENLLRDQGEEAVGRFAADFPELRTRCYTKDFDHAAALDDADVVVVHEWADPALIERLGRLRRAGGKFALLFHDTHHRAVSDRRSISGLELEDYDAVLAFGEALRQLYLDAGWGRRAFTWHEAADDRLFRPLLAEATGDLIWIGNWGDGERSEEIRRFLIEPAKALQLSGEVRGVRYPEDAIAALDESDLVYGGWLANADVPAAFARHRVTMHIPRRPYTESLPGIPTIRMFEALACGIPLVSAPWSDAEGLFRGGSDYLTARDEAEMTARLRDILHDSSLAQSLAASGRQTILARHTCRHRVDELLLILATLSAPAQGAILEAAE